jgi:AraC-like DNA-binding protein
MLLIFSALDILFQAFNLFSQMLFRASLYLLYEGLMNTSTGRWMIESLEFAGVDVEQLLNDLPSEIVDCLDAAENASVDELNTLFLYAEAQTENPHVGLHLGRRTNLRELGLYGYLLLNAHTLGEMLEIAVRYYATLMRNAILNVTKGKETTIIEYKYLMHGKTSSRHDNECTLGSFVYFIRAKLIEDWQPIKTTFTNAAPDSMAELYDVFGENILFDQPDNTIIIETGLLAEPVSDSDVDTGLLAVARENADSLLKSYTKENAFESNVRLLILKNLENRTVNAEAIAREVGMSLSTFNRRLKACRRSFRGLRDDIVISLAKKALADTDSLISDIALMLGYSELSAFDRSFMRLEGMSPNAYREKARESRRQISFPR